MSTINDLFWEWVKLDKSLVDKHEGGYDNYTADEKYALYLNMAMLIYSLKKDSISSIDLSELELNEKSIGVCSSGIETSLFYGSRLDPTRILKEVPAGLQEAIEVVEKYVDFLAENVEEA